MDMIYFVPTLLILHFLGSEGVLGTITAALSLLIATLLYLYGRFGKQKNKTASLLICSAGFVLAAALLMFLPSPMNVVAYIILSAIPINFFSVIWEPMLLLLADKEMYGDGRIRYSFIFDNELFLNTGRLVAIVLFVTPTLFGSELYALIYGPLLVAAAQLLFLVTLRAGSLSPGVAG